MVKENTINVNKSEIVVWSDKYATGIELIDGQHHELVELTNQLYIACLAKEDVLQVVFKDAMSRLVKYVRFHFDAESKLLHAINYPDYRSHKKMHDDLIKNILDTAQEYNEGKKFVPNNLVRTLKDWIFGHIAVYDKLYSAYVMEQIRIGAMTKKTLKEIEKSSAAAAVMA
ncbi:MAG: bacteriohemerythrin [Treponema sp.]|jgi:hemerythrin-like metal-binding protein|nr:bacteriohemerythrin [Treponema sp.]